MDNVRTIGRLKYKLIWEPTGWWYMNRQEQKIYLHFFIGKIEDCEGTTIRQIVVGPLQLSWGWEQ